MTQPMLPLIIACALATAACAKNNQTGPSTPVGSTGTPNIVSYTLADIRIDREAGSGVGNQPVGTSPLQKLPTGLLKVRGRGIAGGTVIVYVYKTVDWRDASFARCPTLGDCGKALLGPLTVVNDVALELGEIKDLTPSLTNETQIIYFVRGAGFVAGFFDVTITGPLPPGVAP